MHFKFLFVISSPLLALSLKCYNGTEEEFQTVESNDINICIYEIIRPCEFTQYLSDVNFRTATYKMDIYQNQCFNEEDRAICYCFTDLCNGDFQLLLERWTAVPHGNETEYDCVKRHLEEKSLYQSRNESKNATMEDEIVAEGILGEVTESSSNQDFSEEEIAKLTAKKFLQQTSRAPLMVRGQSPRKTVIRWTDPAGMSTRKGIPWTETNSTSSIRKEKLPDESDEFPVNFVAYGMIAACFVLLLLLVIPVLIYVFISKNRARREELRKKLVSLEPIQIATPRSTSRSREHTTTGSQELSKEKTQEKDANRKTTSVETIGVERRNRTKSKRRIGSGNRRATVHISMANTVTTPNRRRSRARRGSHSAELMPTKK